VITQLVHERKITPIKKRSTKETSMVAWEERGKRQAILPFVLQRRAHKNRNLANESDKKLKGVDIGTRNYAKNSTNRFRLVGVRPRKIKPPMSRHRKRGST